MRVLKHGVPLSLQLPYLPYHLFLPLGQDPTLANTSTLLFNCIAHERTLSARPSKTRIINANVWFDTFSSKFIVSYMAMHASSQKLSATYQLKHQVEECSLDLGPCRTLHRSNKAGTTFISRNP